MRNVIDYVDCQLEPWKGPNRGDEARGEAEGPQVREDSHVGRGPRWRVVPAKSSFHYLRYSTRFDEGGMVGGGTRAL